MKLRPYQQSAVDDTMAYLKATRERSERPNPLIELPTGAGKSLVLAELAKRILDAHPTTRVLVCTHVKELVEQNAAKFMELCPEIECGIYSAGLDKRQTMQRVIFAGVQSIHKKIADLTRVGGFTALIIDEAHLIPHRDDGMYRSMLQELLLVNPKMRVIGLTATPYRMDGGMLTTGEGKLFHAITHRVTVSDLIKEGYLCPITTPTEATEQYKTDGISEHGGDFTQSALANAIDEIAATSQLVRLGAQRRSWLLFSTSVRHAERISELLNGYGITNAVVSGETPSGERARIVREFRDGGIRAVVNCAVFTTGFDAPATDLVALYRPTKSTGLYVQMVGRGTRLAQGKADCLLLDFGGNIDEHGPIDAVRPKYKSARKVAEAKEYKICPKCNAEVIVGQRTCDECNYVWPQKEYDRTASKTASTSAILSSGDAKTSMVKINRVAYTRHAGKDGKQDTLRCDYFTSKYIKVASEYVCIEHEGYARSKAVAWLNARIPVGQKAPTTIDEALDQVRTWREPTQIQLMPDGAYQRVSAVFEWSPYPTATPTENAIPTASQTPKQPIDTPTQWTAEAHYEAMRAGEDWWTPTA